MALNVYYISEMNLSMYYKVKVVVYHDKQEWINKINKYSSLSGSHRNTHT